MTDATQPTAVADAESHEEEISRLSSAIAMARGSLDEMQKKVGEYDAKYKASETASAYLLPPIERARAAIDSLSKTAVILKDKTAEIPTKALSSALSSAGAALDQVKEVATKYDEKFGLSSTVISCVTVPRDRCMNALGEASHYTASVAAAANAQLQGVNDGIRARALSVASTTVSAVLSTAAGIDQRFGIENKAVDAGTYATDKAKAIDDKLHLSSIAAQGLERAQSLDSRVTGGKVTPVVLSAYTTGLQMATEGLSLLHSSYTSAKQERQEQVCGGATATSVGDEQKKIAEHIKPLVQNYLKKEFAVFECVDALTQVVAGQMHFLKINAGSEHIFAKVMQPLPCNLQPGQDPYMLQGVQAGKSATDKLAFF